MDKLPILGRLRQLVSREELVEQYHQTLTEYALEYPITRNDEQTSRMREIPARERLNRETKEIDIIPLVDPEEIVYDISPAILRELIEKAGTDSPLSQFITETMNTLPYHIFDLIGICDIVHLAPVTTSSGERRFIRHTVQGANPNGEGVLYFPNKNLELLGATVTEEIEGNTSPEQWLKQLSETPIPGFAKPFYQENSENPRRLTSDPLDSPNPLVDILRGDYDGPLYLILRDTETK